MGVGMGSSVPDSPPSPGSQNYGINLNVTDPEGVYANENGTNNTPLVGLDSRHETEQIKSESAH